MVCPPPEAPPEKQVVEFGSIPAFVRAQCAQSHRRSILARSFGGEFEVSIRSAAKRLITKRLVGDVSERNHALKGSTVI